MSPPKALLMPYLDAESDNVPVELRPFVPRLVAVPYADESGLEAFESIVSLDTNTEVDVIKLLAGQHAPNDGGQPPQFIQTILKDSSVIAAISKLNLPADATVYCDPWSYGTDKFSHMNTPAQIQAYLYACTSQHPEINQYAFPLPISPVLDVAENRVIRINTLTTGGIEDDLGHNIGSDAPLPTTRPSSSTRTCLRFLLERTSRLCMWFSRRAQASPCWMGISSNSKNWRFRVGFHYREGLTIHDDRYDGRKVFYRLSMSELTVPYGALYYRKQAFDIGDAGAGACSNALGLGCDCLGLIQYFNAWMADKNGEAGESRNNILTLMNYDYIFAWIFHQNGTVEFETRATGVVSTAPIDKEARSPLGNVVTPGVLAQNHEHFFCHRIDPMIDGTRNTLVQAESVALPETEENPFGNAWTVQKGAFEKSTFADAAPEKNRVFKIRISGNLVGYTLVPLPSQMLLAGKNSVIRQGARFAEHHIWVMRYRDGDLWAGGQWTEQSMKETNGVSDYAARNEDVKNEDIVVWHTIGMSHFLTPEQFPVMGVETLSVALRPTDFFEFNPALDVPRSTQAINNSIQVERKMCETC
ncbi:Copper amine oxidase, N2/N3-terminal [Penicillium griseofulvum]|uniref:Amine oxidase n=1 Tax=Penicillium patulum TaxID=5078 RepID=A0A135LQH3_PENPA|nr:Copper amine oxidase, N2/N3-terminal [Penicillium griseofulvum]KXG51201.1 Copper amine oxidase, N2/N3-terminal [Penicillium griseofulvum]